VIEGLIGINGFNECGAELKRAEYDMAPAIVHAMDPFDVEQMRLAGLDVRHTVEQYLVLSTNRFAVRLTSGDISAAFGTLVRVRDQWKAELGQRTEAAQLWMFCTVHIAKAPIRTRKLVRHAVRELLAYYDGLYGYIDPRHVRMIRFCEWIGGELGEPEPFGDNKALFRRLTFR
jgi:hypothetical protein